MDYFDLHMQEGLADLAAPVIQGVDLGKHAKQQLDDPIRELFAKAEFEIAAGAPGALAKGDSTNDWNDWNEVVVDRNVDGAPLAKRVSEAGIHRGENAVRIEKTSNAGQVFVKEFDSRGQILRGYVE